MEASSSRQRVVPPSLAAVSVGKGEDANADDEVRELTPSLARPSAAPTRVARPRLLIVETNPSDMRTPTPTSSTPPRQRAKPRRRAGYGLLGLCGVVAAAIAVFLARPPAFSIRDRMEARPSAAISPLASPSAPVVDHVAMPTCPEEMAAVAEPLTSAPYCIDRIGIDVESVRACPKVGPCAARDVAARYCTAHGKRLATDAELALAKTNLLVEPRKNATKTKTHITSFRCARSL
jgi:hypothetical protein